MSGTILAILVTMAGTEWCLDAARQAAAALPGARLLALHVRLDPDSTIIPSEEILTPRQRRALALQAESEAAALHAAFADWRAQQQPEPPTEWREVTGTVTDQVTRLGSTAALIVMAAPAPHARGRALEALHAALFGTHRLLLLVPQHGPARPPRRIAIGWKDSAVCRAAITEAAPWLRQADAVDVLHAVARDPAELEAASRLLHELGVAATLHALPRGDAPVGAQLLAEAAARHADWLLIGAYRRPQAVEWLLGGVTRTVLREARLPVLMLH